MDRVLANMIQPGITLLRELILPSNQGMIILLDGYEYGELQHSKRWGHKLRLDPPGYCEYDLAGQFSKSGLWFDLEKEIKSNTGPESKKDRYRETSRVS